MCALLFRPVEFYTRGRQLNPHTAEVADITEKPEGEEYPNVKESDVDLERIKGSSEVSLALVQNPSNRKEEKAKESTSGETKRHRNLDLFKDVTFVMYSAALFVTMAGYWIAVVILVPANGATVGLTRRRYALLVSLMGAGDIVGRPLMGFLADRKFIHKRALFMFNCCTTGVVILIMPHVGDQYVPLAVISVCIGLFGGQCVTLPPSILGDIVSKDTYTTAVGWMAFFMGTPALFSQSLASE